MTVVPGLSSTDGSEDRPSGGLLPCTFDTVWQPYNSLILKPYNSLILKPY